MRILSVVHAPATLQPGFSLGERGDMPAVYNALDVFVLYALIVTWDDTRL